MGTLYFDGLDYYVNGTTVLSAKIMYSEVGEFCMLQLPNVLKMENAIFYIFKIKFKLFTSSPNFNFCVRRFSSREFQAICVHKVTPQNKNTWITIEKEFTPNDSYYDEFMIGTAQLRRENTGALL